MDYILKQTPEDFAVKEIFEPKLDEGKYGLYILWKRSYTTEKAVQTLSRRLRIRPKYFNSSGNKDKYAVTEQYITISRGPRRDIEMNDIKLTYLGQTSERMNLGTASGNHFEIVVRGLQESRKTASISSFPNYYDEQRFGRNLNNHEIGRLLVNKDFQKACSMIPEVQDRLKSSPTDFVGALRSLPKGILRIYANSFQSWLWNLTASAYISQFPHTEIEYPLGRLCVPTNPLKNLDVPILGHETEIPESLEGIVKELLASHDIDLRDFRIPQIPEFDLSGDTRPLLVVPENLKTGKPEDDELNPGKKKILVSFSLPNGNYATMLVRCMLSP